MAPLSWIASYPTSGGPDIRVAVANYLLDRPASPDEIDRLAPDVTSLAAAGRLLPLDDPPPLIAGTELLPDAPLLRRYEHATVRVLYLVRNPREVIPSAVRYLGASVAKRADLARHFITRGGLSDLIPGMWGPWHEHVRAWTCPDSLHRYFPRAEVLTVRIEDLKRAPADGLRQITGFLDLGDGADPERLNRAVANLAPDKMRAAEASQDHLSHLPFVYRPAPPPAEPPACRSLADLGQDIEAAYERLLAEDEEFSRCARRCGYET